MELQLTAVQAWRLEWNKQLPFFSLNLHVSDYKFKMHHMKIRWALQSISFGLKRFEKLKEREEINIIYNNVFVSKC